MSESESVNSSILEVQGSSALSNTTIIRPIANEAELLMVHRLTHDCYVSEGYAPPQPHARLAHYAEFDCLPQTTVFVAIHQGEVVGSISMTVDGPGGLTTDKDFKDECDAMRYAGRRLATVWRFVRKPSIKHLPCHILKSLIKETIALATSKGANTWLFAVNPWHTAVYRRLFKTTEVSVKGSTKGLSNAPAALLRVDYEDLQESWTSPIEVAQFSHAA